MPGKFQNKYRISSTRAPWWDYGRNASYFATICTHDRICYFGEIVVETRLIASLQSPDNATEQPKTIGGFAGNKNPMLNNNLSRIIRWYKGRTTFESRKIHADFAWQASYHEHIIRNEQSYQKISDYIINNPAKWNDDKLYIQ